MGMEDTEAVERLQGEIDAAFAKYDCRHLDWIRLDHGSEVADLSMCADVRVCRKVDTRWRLFSICSEGFIHWVFDVAAKEPNPHRPDVIDVYATGGPMIIVTKITGDSIVRGVLRQIELADE